MNDLLKAVETEKNANIPDLMPGDVVSVHVKIKEGDRERIQEFKGTVSFSPDFQTYILRYCKPTVRYHRCNGQRHF